MSRKQRKNVSRAQRKETRRKSIETPTAPSSTDPAHPAAPQIESAAPPDTAQSQSQDAATIRNSRRSRLPLLHVFCGFLALISGIWINQSHRETAPSPQLVTPDSSSSAPRLPQFDAPAETPVSLGDWLESTLAEFRAGTLSAFRFRKLLGERVKESTLQHVRDFIGSGAFNLAPDAVRSITLQRLSEASAPFVRTLFESDSPPNLTELEVHTLLGSQAAADLPDFALWVSSLSPKQQLSLAHELAAPVIAEPSRVAALVGTLAPDTAQRVLQEALTELKSHPTKIIAFATELPPTLAQQALLQGLQLSLTLPHVAKGFSLAQHPRAASLIHECIRARETALPYRGLLAAEGVAESLPQGVARSLAFEFLFQRIAGIHLESALLRLSKLTNPQDREYATLGAIQGCARTQPLRALELAVTLPFDSPRRHEALLLAAYAARTLDTSITQRWLSSAPLNPDERALLTGELP